MLKSLLATTERVVQEIDSVEYGLTDIQEYYANTGALKVAAETAIGKKCSVSIVEAFRDDDDGPMPKELDDVLRLEYRSKLLNPKWADAMLVPVRKAIRERLAFQLIDYCTQAGSGVRRCLRGIDALHGDGWVGGGQWRGRFCVFWSR